MANKMTNMLPYACCKDLRYFIVYDLDLPFDIYVFFDFHEIAIESLHVDFLTKAKRSIVLKSDRKWQESINICGRDVVSIDLKDYENSNVKYTSSITSLQIIVPIFDNEISSCLAAFKCVDNISLLLSNIMYLLKNKFNEILVTDFNLDVSTYGAERAFIYQLDENQDMLKAIGGVISPRYSLPQKKKLPVGSVGMITGDAVCMWRYYANKCEISFNLNQNLDCILFAAIAIESYVNSIYKDNGLINTEDNLFAAIKSLKDSGFLSSSDYLSIKKAFGKIKDFRNGIIHGRVESVLQDRKKATIAYNSIVTLFAGRIIQPTSKPPQSFSDLRTKFESIIKAIRNKDFDSQISNLELFVKKKTYTQVANYYLGICHLYRKEYDLAKFHYLECYKAKRFYIQSVYSLAFIECQMKNVAQGLAYIEEGIDYISKQDKPSELCMKVKEALENLAKFKEKCQVAYWL